MNFNEPLTLKDLEGGAALIVDPVEKTITVLKAIAGQSLYTHMEHLYGDREWWGSGPRAIIASSPFLFRLFDDWSVINPELVDCTAGYMAWGLLDAREKTPQRKLVRIEVQS